MMRKHAFKLALMLSMLLAYNLLSCDNRYSTSTLIINEIIDPIGINPVVYVALSRTPDFLGGTKTYTATYDLANPGTSAVVFESINWESKNEVEAGEFWLLIAEDANTTGVIDDLDNILPAMRIILKDSQTTTIERVIFDSTTGLLDKHINGVQFSDPARTFRIFVEDPSLISLTNKMYLRLGNINTLLAIASASHEIPIADPQLVSGLSARVGATNGFLWIDANGSLVLDAGDWVSTPNPDDAPPLTDFNSIILWSGQTY